MIVLSPPAYPSPSWNMDNMTFGSFSWDGHLLLHPLSTPCVPEAFCKRVVVDLQLCHLLVLICCHCYELTLLKNFTFSNLFSAFGICLEIGVYLEHIGPKGWIGELKDVTGPDQVEPGLVLVHRVQDRLQSEDFVKICFYNHHHRHFSFSVFTILLCINLWRKTHWLHSCNWENWPLWKSWSQVRKERGGQEKVSSSSTCELPPKRQKQTS